MSVTIERLEYAVRITALCMLAHDLPQLMPTLKRLQAELDRVRAEGDPLIYAKKVLAA